MPRPQSRYVCQACGGATLRWEGQCRSCGAWNTLVETLVRDAPRGNSPARGGGTARPLALADVPASVAARYGTGIPELDRVLGGGLVPGSVVLLGGEPGIGKSTLVLEAAASVLATRRDEATVLYASAEESPAQLRMRAERLGLLDGRARPGVEVVAESDVETIVEAAAASGPALLVVDSVQAVTVAGLEGPQGSVGQVREAAAAFTRYAKDSGVPVVLVGHVTKEGALAGPKTLEHLVDVVLTLDGERYGPLRLLRASKNRFGSTDEVGVFEMAGAGLRELADAARAFLGEGGGERGRPAAGVCVGAALEGSRPILVEVQTLVTPAPYGSPRRTVSGLDGNRLALLVAVLGRRAGVNLGGHDIYASLAGGLRVEEPSLDLPLALALASSARDRAVRPATVACGEIGLLGELRPVRGLERRLAEARRLGFRRAIVPAASGSVAATAGESRGSAAGPDDLTLEVVRAASLREALEAALLPKEEAVSAR